MDPGIITSEYYLENYEVEKMKINNSSICKKCNAIIDFDKGVSHCPDCNICIFGNDHHCPWTSKCVGEKNKYFFIAFIMSLLLHLALIIINFIISLININKIKK